MSFKGIVVHQLWSFAFSRERSRAQMREWHITLFWATGMVPPLGVGALRKLRTLLIGSGRTHSIVAIQKKNLEVNCVNVYFCYTLYSREYFYKLKSGSNLFQEVLKLYTYKFTTTSTLIIVYLLFKVYFENMLVYLLHKVYWILCSEWVPSDWESKQLIKNIAIIHK